MLTAIAIAALSLPPCPDFNPPARDLQFIERYTHQLRTIRERLNDPRHCGLSPEEAKRHCEEVTAEILVTFGRRLSGLSHYYPNSQLGRFIRRGVLP
jgi:hypothetical protein